MSPRPLDRGLVLVVGTGGVGKTTLAAALAAEAAASGRRALVLTVDPARRLASALGVSLGDAVATVTLPRGASGSLGAAMLESGASFDALLVRIVPDPAVRASILASATYRAFSRSLARSHAYAAIERIHSVALGDDAHRYDVVVVDTPPGGAALALFDAPGALARFAGDRIAVALSGGGASALLVGARALFGALAGRAVANELADFLAAFLPARSGFQARALELDAELRGSARRLLVVAPDEVHLREAGALVAALEARDLRPHGIVANRARRRTSPRYPLAEVVAVVPPVERPVFELAHRVGEAERALDEARAARLASFARSVDLEIVRSVSAASEEPTHVAALIELVRETGAHAASR